MVQGVAIAWDRTGRGIANDGTGRGYRVRWYSSWLSQWMVQRVTKRRGMTITLQLYLAPGIVKEDEWPD